MTEILRNKRRDTGDLRCDTEASSKIECTFGIFIRGLAVEPCPWKISKQAI